MKPVKGWAICNKRGLYVGWWLRRRDAIEGHTQDLEANWQYCLQKGDRVVKVLITEIVRKKKGRGKK